MGWDYPGAGKKRKHQIVSDICGSRYSTVRRLNITDWWRMMGLSEKKEVEQWVTSREIRLRN